MNREARQQDPNTIIDTPNTEKQEHCNGNEPKSNNNWNTTHPDHIEQRKTQKEKMNIEILKRIVSEKKTRLPSLKTKTESSQGRNWKNKRTINAYLTRTNSMQERN